MVVVESVPARAFSAMKDMQTIISDLRHESEDEELTSGLQRMKHHDTVKVGCVHRMTEKKCLQQWTDRLTKLVFALLSFKSLISLQARKINDGSCNKENRGTNFKIMTRNKKK